MKSEFANVPNTQIVVHDEGSVLPSVEILRFYYDNFHKVVLTSAFAFRMGRRKGNGTCGGTQVYILIS